VSNLQPADKSEGDNFFLAVGDSGELMLEEIVVRPEVVILPHSDGEQVVTTLLGLLAGGVLGKERFSHLSEVVEGEWQQ